MTAVLDQTLAQGLNLHQQGKTAEARVCYELVLRTAPRNTDALHLLGLLVAAEGEIDRGTKLIQEATRIQPRYPAALFNLGNLLYRQDRFEEAAASFQRAVALQPKFADAYRNLGNTFVALERFADAAAAFQRAAKLNPIADLHYNLGYALQKLGKLDEAILSFRQAIALKADFANAHRDLGQSLHALGEIEAATNALQRAVAIAPTDASAWRSLGACHQAAEDPDEAMACYRKALEIDPEFTVALKQRAFRLLQQRRLSDAAVALRQAGILVPLARNSRPEDIPRSIVQQRHECLVELPGGPVMLTFSIVVSDYGSSVLVCAPAFFQVATGATITEALERLHGQVFGTTTPQVIAHEPARSTPESETGPSRFEIPEQADLVYLFGYHLEQSQHWREALECLRHAAALGFNKHDFLFHQGRLSAFLGHLDEAISLHSRGLAACLRDGKNPAVLGTVEIPACLRDRPTAGIFELLREFRARFSVGHDGHHLSSPANVCADSKSGDSADGTELLKRLVQIEAHNHLAEDLINYYCDFKTAYRIYERRAQLQQEWRAEGDADNQDILFLGSDWTRNIGHIAFIGVLVKMRELGLAPWRHIVLLVHEKKLANRAYLDCWRQHIHIIDDESQVARFEPLVTVFGFRFSTLFPISGRSSLYTNKLGSAVETAWEAAGKAPLLRLSPEAKQIGWNSLVALGVPAGSWFVCLHVRESGYYREAGEARNAPIDSYLPAIKAITDRGGWVIRLGDASMSPLPKMAQVADYARSEAKSPAMDVFLCAQCRFMIGTNSGLSHVPYSFGVPVLITNWAITGGFPYFRRNGLFQPKLIYSKKQDRVLPFREMLSEEWRSRSYKAAALEAEAAQLIDNSPEDIADITSEMLEQCDGASIDSDDEALLQRQFRELLTGEFVDGLPKIGRGFLKRHSALLP
jgi:putative glycosyltransferase (TIGR04372 family)